MGAWSGVGNSVWSSILRVQATGFAPRILQGRTLERPFDLSLAEKRHDSEGVQRHVAFVRNAWWDLAQYSILDHEFAHE